MTAIAPVAPGVLDIGRGLGRAWARAAGAALIGPTRWWAECFVLLTAWSQTPAASAGRRLVDRIPRPERALRRPPVTDPEDDDPRLPRRTRRWYPTPRGTFRVLVWTAVVACVGGFAASLAVPAWYGLHDQQLLIVTSGSMSPFVEAGDVAVLQSIDDPSQLRVGQVATFWPPGSICRSTIRWVTRCLLPGGQNVATWPTRSWLGSSIDWSTATSPASTNGDIEPEVTMSSCWSCRPYQAGTARLAANPPTHVTTAVHTSTRNVPRGVGYHRRVRRGRRGSSSSGSVTGGRRSARSGRGIRSTSRRPALAAGVCDHAVSSTKHSAHQRVGPISAAPAARAQARPRPRPMSRTPGATGAIAVIACQSLLTVCSARNVSTT